MDSMQKDRIIDRAEGNRELGAKVRDIAQAIASAPQLKDLTDEQIRQVAEKVVFNRYATQLNKAADLFATDYIDAKQTFLHSRNSKHTRKGYEQAFKAFELFTRERGMENPLECTPAAADDWIYSMRAEQMAAATIRRNAAAMSSFFTFIDRRTNGAIRNPFAGTKALPQKEPTKQIETEILTTNLALFAKDINTIIDNETDIVLKAIIVCMARRGLRAGAFEHLSIHGGRFFTLSKGKRIDGVMPSECIDAIKAARLKLHEPFTQWASAKISAAFEYHIAKLYKAGKISYKYSCHDLRHFYALTEYTEHKDIYRVSKLLHHASVNVTQAYLRGLKVEA